MPVPASVDLHLPFDATAPRHARRAAASLGANDEASLVVGELVTNAVRHGDAPIRFYAARTRDGLRIEVSDTRPDLGSRKADSMGLRLLDSFASAWGVENRNYEKTVWAVVPI